MTKVPDGPRRRPRRRSFAALLAVPMLLAVLLAGCSAAPSAASIAYAREQRAVQAAITAVGVRLPSGADALAPRLGPRAFAHPLPAHQVLGFVPYWALGDLGAEDLSDSSTIVYFALDAAASGGILRGGPGFDKLHSTAVHRLIVDAHRDHDAVLLAVSTTDQQLLDGVARHPTRAAGTLVHALGPVLATMGFNGIDLDYEGQGAADRDGFSTFVSEVSVDLHRVAPNDELVLDTYPTSAADSDGFFDIARLAPVVNELFIMGYDMADPSIPSANAPLISTGISDAGALQSYTATVDPRKLLLGIPFYGYTYDATSLGPNATAIGSPVAVTDAAIVASGVPARWDPATLTPWMVVRDGRHWSETFFDDPVSVALKTALASVYRCGGVGVWYLGAGGANPALHAALLGGGTALRAPLDLPPTPARRTEAP